MNLRFTGAVFFVLVDVILIAQVEEFPLAVGPPNFGEQPWVQGNLVVWQRYAASRLEADVLQCRDISRLDSPVIDVAEYPASRVGVILSPEFLFRGASNGFGDGSPVLARPIPDLRNNQEVDIVVSDFGRAVAATRQFVFIKVAWYERDAYKNKILAKSVEKLGDEGPDSLRVVANLRNERRQGELNRMEAASDNYFIWQDRDQNRADDSWKIYLKATEDLFRPRTERMIFDTGAVRDLGVYLALHDSLLIVQAARKNNEQGIYLLDLDVEGEVIPLATTVDPETTLIWPSISAEYAAWTEIVNFFERSAYAVRLTDGRPVGEITAISTGTTGGSWLTIDGNIAVWNGSASVNGGGIQAAIVAAELPLPGADDVGDVDQNGQINLTDALIILNYLFRSKWKPRDRLADTDLNGEIELLDAMVILRYLYRGGSIPGAEAP